MKNFKKTLITCLLAVFMVAFGFAGLTSIDKKATVEAEGYTVVDSIFMANIEDCYREGGNFYLSVVMPNLDTNTVATNVAYDTSVDDMPTMFANFKFYDKVKINGYTLRELGCTATWDNAFDVNSSFGSPMYKIAFHMHADPTVWQKAIADGKVTFGVGSNVTISEGTLIPGYEYMTGDHSATVYRAGCDFDSLAADVPYSIMSVGKTDVESLDYVTGWDSNYNNAYLGVSLRGDDYLGAGTQKEMNYGNYQSSFYTSSLFINKITADDVGGKAESYGLFNLGELGKGYFSFVFRAPEEETEKIFIPAGTYFPSQAMVDLFNINGNPVYMMYQTQNDATFYKQADGSWAKEISTTVEHATLFGSSADAFAGIKVAGNDYATAGDTYAGKAKTALSFAQSENFLSHVLIDDAQLATPGEAFLNVWTNFGYFTFRPGNNSATKITLKEGLKLPTYNALQNGAGEVYVISEDVTFIKNSSGEWVADGTFDAPAYIAEVSAELDAYKSGAFREAEEAQRLEIVASAKTAISALTDKAGIDQAVANAKTSIDALKTAAQYASEELAQAKASAKAEISAYLADGEYNSAQSTRKAIAVQNGHIAVDSAIDEDAIAQAVVNAKAEIDALIAGISILDTVMISRLAGWYGNGNFEINITLGSSDFADVVPVVEAYSGELTQLLIGLDFFNHIKLGEKTLAEWGCKAVYANQYWINHGEPKCIIRIPLAMGAENMALATAAGIGANSPVTILEGALIPGYQYLKGNTTATVYRAGCDFVTTEASVNYGIQSAGKTEVESVKYVQGHDGTCGYFGISFVGDDYLGDGAQVEVDQNYWYDNFTSHVLVNGEAGKVIYYGLFNLGEAGKGYYSFGIYVPEADLQTITIPAGTLFPTRAMNDFKGVNSGNGVHVMFEVQTTVTYCKLADGSYVKLQDYQADKIAEVNSYRESKANGEYFQAEIDAMDAGLAQAITAINNATNVSEIDAIVTALKSGLDGAETKAVKVERANQELDGYKAEDGYYREAEATQRASIIATAKEGIANATTEAEIAQLVEGAKVSIDALKTASQYADEELAQAKASANAQINDYLADEVYLAEQAEALASAKAVGLQAIVDATNEDQIAQAVENAKQAMNAIETKATIVARANEQLDSYKADVFYREAEATQKASIIASAKASVASATTEAQVNELVAGAKADIDELKTDAQLTLEEAVATATAELNAYKAEVEYREAEIAQRAQAIESAVAGLATATSQGEIDEIVANAKATIDALKTNEQYLAEESLLVAKANGLAEVNGVKASIDFDCYKDEDLVLINNSYANAITAIENANSEAEVQQIVDEFNALIEGIEQINPENKDVVELASCNASANAGSILALLCIVALTGVVLKKKMR